MFKSCRICAIIRRQILKYFLFARNIAGVSKFLEFRSRREIFVCGAKETARRGGERERKKEREN